MILRGRNESRAKPDLHPPHYVVDAYLAAPTPAGP